MVRKFTKSDEGVSAVIGVILMVAITVILAAVIAAFVFSMSGNVSKPYTVGITIKKDTSGNIIITNVGGPDVGSLDVVTLTYQMGTNPIQYYNDAETDDFTPTAPTGSVSAGTDYDLESLHNVGGSFTIPVNGAQTHVIVTGKFRDGKSQVIGESDV